MKATKKAAYKIIVLTACSFLITACTPNHRYASTRTIVLNGTEVSETDALGEFISYGCRDFVDRGKIVVEVGRFSAPKAKNMGYVLYDGGNSGTFTLYSRDGLNHRWDWGDYSFIIKPDGNGLFYDFTGVEEGGSTKASDLYRCRKY